MNYCIFGIFSINIRSCKNTTNKQQNVAFLFISWNSLTFFAKRASVKFNYDQLSYERKLL